ncbi:LysR family transcriptional regulator [Streptomyces gamaensis]|uniref:LysR family transcriptional regulator n=1 Tax=Streptomyces gamaensis TaxID=1763542 RepID=A0ABW0Z8Q3_9ACTN
MDGGLDLRELECFLALAEELHFGRTGDRLYVSQSRVSQLLRSLEGRIGARLVDRTSRRVALTPLGERFLTQLRPSYAALAQAVADARDAARGVEGVLRVGFQGTANGALMRAVDTFQSAHPACAVDLVEIPLGDPFGAVRGGEVDAAVVLLPVREPDLVLGPVFSRQRQTLAVSVRHVLARRAELSAEELASCPLVAPSVEAPPYWREAQAPTRTPAGRPVPPGPVVTTLQEGITATAANRAAMLLCRSTADYHAARRDVAFVPVTGLPDSALGLVWRRAGETERVREFARVVGEAVVV